MKIITVLGSPRGRGNTAAVLSAFERIAGEHHGVKRLRVPRRAVNGCLGCDVCQRVADGPGCFQDDWISQAIHEILEADLVVYASPVYVWGFPAQMKALLDRHYCLVKSRLARYLFEGMPTMLLTTCGGSAEANADLIEQIFAREMAYLHGRVVSMHCVPDCSKPAHLGDRAEQTARRMLDDVLGVRPRDDRSGARSTA
jgi:multimeric flavodoxin WrbA